MSLWSSRTSRAGEKTGIWRLDRPQAKPSERVVTHASQVQRIAGCLTCRADRRLGASAFSFGRVKKSLTFLLCSDAGHGGHCGLGVAQWDACRLTLLFPLRRAAVSLDGWSARPCKTSNGIWFWKRSLIPVGTERRRHTCLAYRCGHCGTRSSNIQQRVSAFLAMRATTRSWRNPPFCCFGGVIGNRSDDEAD